MEVVRQIDNGILVCPVTKAPLRMAAGGRTLVSDDGSATYPVDSNGVPRLLPLGKEYDEYIKSDVADQMNTSKRGAGTIAGAKFLEPFAGDTPWVHLDIAGVDMMTSEKGWVTKGASGYSVRALINLGLAEGS